MLQSLFQNVIEITLTTSAVIAALMLLLPLIHKSYTAKWRYCVWLVLAVRLLIPFSLSLPQTPIEIILPSQNIEFKVPVQNTTASPLSDNTAVPQAVKDSTAAGTITLNEILSILWVLGIAVFMLYHLAGYFLFKRSVLRFSRPVEDEQITGLWCEVKEEMKISQNIRLLSCKKVKSPMMTGFFKPILLLPKLALSSSDLKIILKHELIHYKRGDIWYKLLLICANAVHWFNPLMYFMTAMSNKNIEMVCDSEVIRDSDISFRKQYSETILSAIHKGSLRRTSFSTYFYGGKKTMKERFINIFDMNKKRSGIITFLIVLISVALIGGIVACGTQRADNNAAGVVRKHLEATKNNDYDTWISTMIKEKQSTFTKEANGVFGVISLRVDKVEISDEETQRMKGRYLGSDLAQSRGWSDKYISENMIVVSTKYTVDYDNTKVPYNEGTLTQDFILIRDDKDSPWLIWDSTSPAA